VVVDLWLTWALVLKRAPLAPRARIGILLVAAFVLGVWAVIRGSQLPSGDLPAGTPFMVGSIAAGRIRLSRPLVDVPQSPTDCRTAPPSDAIRLACMRNRDMDPEGRDRAALPGRGLRQVAQSRVLHRGQKSLSVRMTAESTRFPERVLAHCCMTRFRGLLRKPLPRQGGNQPVSPEHLRVAVQVHER